MHLASCWTAQQTLIRLHKRHHSSRLVAMASVRVYNGDGAGSRSVLSAVETMQRAVVSEVKVGLPVPCSTLYHYRRSCLSRIHLSHRHVTTHQLATLEAGVSDQP